MTTKKTANKLTLTIQFDMKDDSFGRFCKALIGAGFESEVREMAALLLKEAKRRKLPIADEIEGGRNE